MPERGGGGKPALLAALRRLDPAAPLRIVVVYRFCYWIVVLVITLVYRARFMGTRHVPSSGGVLVVANHQSHLDPPLVGAGVRYRNTAPIARRGLFRVPVLGPLLRAIGCISINDEEGDAGAIRASIAALKAGRVLIIFPEGTRSPDGRLTPFKRGAWVLIARSGVPVVPAAVSGCFEAWPRGNAFPRLFGQRIAVRFGEPIAYADLKAMGSDAALALLEARVGDLFADLEHQRNRARKGP